MSRNIPFFEFFAELSVAPELRLRLAGAELTHGCIDQAERSIQLDMKVKSPLDQETLQQLREALKGVYGFQRVELNVTAPGQRRSQDGQEAGQDLDGESHQGPSWPHVGAEREDGDGHGLGQGIRL